jgi:ankyrin repeat protein
MTEEAPEEEGLPPLDPTLHHSNGSDTVSFVRLLVQDILQVSTWTLASDYKVGYNAVVEEDGASVRSGKRGGQSYSLGQHPHVDWDHVYTLWTGLSPDEQRAAANHVLHGDGDDCLLLHYLCLLPAAPSDVVTAVLRVTNEPSRPCGLGLQATPLHLACFTRGSNVTTVKALVTAAPGLVYQRDAYGRLPLHMTSLSRAADLVRVLLETDRGGAETIAAQDNAGLTALQLAVGRCPVVVAQLLQACQESDASPTNDFSMRTHLEQGLPLHRAIRRESGVHRLRSVGQVVRMLAKCQTNLVTSQDHRGQTALHVALEEGTTSVDSLRALLTLDMTRATFSTKDVLGQTPVDILLSKMIQQPETALPTIRALIKADEERCFWGTVNEKHESLLDRYLDHLLAKNAHDNLASDVLYQLLLATPPGTGSYGVAATQTQTLIGRAAYTKFLGDAQWHKTMNRVMSQRIFTFYFMLDLYVRVLLVVMYSMSTHRRLSGSQETGWAFALTYLCASYLLLWQLKLMLRYELYYVRDAWSLLDVITLIMVITSAALLQTGESVSSRRSFHVLVGGMTWFVTLTVALRSTFLPFAIFVSGLMKILLYMIPFGTVTFLMLGAFAEMFYKAMIQRPECAIEGLVEADFCRFGDSFLAVYNMFLSGIDPSLLQINTAPHLLWLSLTFQVTFAIVMLNVLVAVIFDAWGDVSPRGRIVFGLHRHRFLMEATEKGWYCLPSSSMGKPYLKSLDAHVSAVVGRCEARPAISFQSTSWTVKLTETVYYILETMYLVVWFLLGLCTAGILWAKPFREAIFSFRQEDGVGPDDGKVTGGEEMASLDSTRHMVQHMRGEIQSLRALVLEKRKEGSA